MSIYLFDGQLYSSMQRHMQARHHLLYSAEHGVDFGSERIALNVTDWVFVTKCISHACSNATVWGLRRELDTLNRDDVHIVIAALNNSSSALHASIDVYLMRHLQPVRTRSASDDEIRAFWAALDVEPTILNDFVEADLVFDGVNLQASHRVTDLNDGYQRIEALLLYCLRFIDWSETRWVKVGRSGRYYMRARAVGVTELVGVVRSDPSFSMTMAQLNGFSRVTMEIDRFLCRCAFSVYASESAYLRIMEDDRWLRAMPELKSIVEELHSLDGLPMYVWSRCAQLIDGTDASELRDSALYCANTAAGYLYAEVFSLAEEFPLSLTQGNIHENLQQLRGSQHPVDPTTEKIRKCALGVGGIAIASLIRALEFLRDNMPGTTNIVEQNHACGAKLIKKHAGYEEATLRARGVTQQFRPIFTPTHDQKVRIKLTQQLKALQTGTTRLSGKHLLLGELARKAARKGKRRASSSNKPQATMADANENGESSANASSVTLKYELISESLRSRHGDGMIYDMFKTN